MIKIKFPSGEVVTYADDFKLHDSVAKDCDCGGIKQMRIIWHCIRKNLDSNFKGWDTQYNNENHTPDCENLDCDGETCSSCCPHDDVDHFECMYCGENLMGDMIDRADYFQDR